jgi:AcrR family transcriptional regulator
LPPNLKGIKRVDGSKGRTRRRGDAEETRRRVLDVVVATVMEIGYYNTSSNEIARRAGVTWGSIQHLFGSREQLMLDVVNDIGRAAEERISKAVISGETLEERLDDVLNVLGAYYGQDIYIVQMQILLELSANPKMSALADRVVDRGGAGIFDRLAGPLLSKALGAAADDHEVVFFAFMTMRSFLIASAITRRIADLPEGAILRLMGKSGDLEGADLRGMVVRGLSVMIREELARRKSLAANAGG